MQLETQPSNEELALTDAAAPACLSPAKLQASEPAVIASFSLAPVSVVLG